jgi:hypothetical protein
MEAPHSRKALTPSQSSPGQWPRRRVTPNASRWQPQDSAEWRTAMAGRAGANVTADLVRAWDETREHQASASSVLLRGCAVAEAGAGFESSSRAGSSAHPARRQTRASGAWRNLASDPVEAEVSGGSGWLLLLGSCAMRSAALQTLAFMPRPVSRASARVPSFARIRGRSRSGWRRPSASDVAACVRYRQRA